MVPVVYELVVYEWEYSRNNKEAVIKQDWCFLRLYISFPKVTS